MANRDSACEEIYLTLCGGLGNQMFQYASGLGFATRLCRKLIIDPFTGFSKDPYKRQYGLAAFHITASSMSAHEAVCMRRKFDLQGRVRWRLEQIAMRQFGRSYVPALARPLWPDKPIYLRTYLQSHRYFYSAETLKSEFALAASLGPAAMECAKAINSRPNSTALHFRLAYNVSAEGELVGTTPAFSVPWAYYRQALEALRRSNAHLSLFVFSDQTFSNSEWLQEFGEVTYLPRGTERTAAEDMFLMSLCRYHIISASTFSWWGAWLSCHTEKKVYAPRHFFPFRRPVRTSDIYPVEWSVLSATSHLDRISIPQ